MRLENLTAVTNPLWVLEVLCKLLANLLKRDQTLHFIMEQKNYFWVVSRSILQDNFSLRRQKLHQIDYDICEKNCNESPQHGDTYQSAFTP